MTGELGVDGLGEFGLGDATTASDTTYRSDSDAGSGTESADRDPEGSDSGAGDDQIVAGPIEGEESGAGDDQAGRDPTTSETGSASDSATSDTARQTAEEGFGVDSAGTDAPAPSETAVGVDSAFVTKLATDSACGSYSGPIEIRYDGLDITSCVLFEAASFKSAANGKVGSCTVRVKDRAHAFAFVSGRTLELFVDGIRQWDGYVTKVLDGYFVIGGISAPGEVTRYFELQGVDRNVLFQKRVLFDKRSPTNMRLTSFPAGTHDDVILKHYLENHIDLSGDGLSLSGIEYVGTPSQDSNIIGSAGWFWGDLASFVRFNTGAIDYISPDRVVIHTDVDTPTSSLHLTDVPSGDETELGYREMEIDFEAEQMRNDALVWGMGGGSAVPVFKRTQDATALAVHDRWQIGQVSQGVWKQSTVDRIANSLVYGSPQNKRGGKDDAVAVRCIVFKPLRVGQKVAFESQVFGFSDVLPVRTVDIDFPTPKQARFQVVLSHEIDDPWSSIDPFSISLPPFPDFPQFQTPAEEKPCSYQDAPATLYNWYWDGLTGHQFWVENTGGVPYLSRGLDSSALGGYSAYSSWSAPVGTFGTAVVAPADAGQQWFIQVDNVGGHVSIGGKTYGWSLVSTNWGDGPPSSTDLAGDIIASGTLTVPGGLSYSYSELLPAVNIRVPASGRVQLYLRMTGSDIAPSDLISIWQGFNDIPQTSDLAGFVSYVDARCDTYPISMRVWVSYLNPTDPTQVSKWGIGLVLSFGAEEIHMSLSQAQRQTIDPRVVAQAYVINGGGWTDYDPAPTFDNVRFDPDGYPRGTAWIEFTLHNDSYLTWQAGSSAASTPLMAIARGAGSPLGRLGFNLLAGGASVGTIFTEPTWWCKIERVEMSGNGGQHPIWQQPYVDDVPGSLVILGSSMTARILKPYFIYDPPNPPIEFADSGSGGGGAHAVLKANTAIDTSGWTCSEPVPVDGSGPGPWFELPAAFVAGTASVWVNGARLRYGVDYGEIPTSGIITIDPGIDLAGASLYACYQLWLGV